MGTPTAVILAALVLLLGVSVATGWDKGTGGAAASVRIAPLATIERRVETLRDLRFRSALSPQSVTPDQATKEGLADLDRSYPKARRLADEEVLKLLGLIDAKVDLRKVSSSIFGEQVAGYYDPRTRRLRVVKGASTSSRVLTEITLAHEMTHALEDQTFKLDQEDLGSNDDRSLAYLALVEGSATDVMYEYARRYFSSQELLSSSLGAAFQGTGGLPPFLTAQLLFPYERGLQFVQRLYATADGWTLVNAAYRSHPPVSTEQIMHPDAYLRFEKPKPVRLGAGRVLGKGWEKAVGGVLGEWETGEVLAQGGGGAQRAADGWGGDRYELWRSTPLGSAGCGPPCPRQDALVIRWRWDRPADERDFLAALRRWVAEGLETGGGVAIARSDAGVTLALAPSTRLARRLASGS